MVQESEMNEEIEYVLELSIALLLSLYEFPSKKNTFFFRSQLNF